MAWLGLQPYFPVPKGEMGTQYVLRAVAPRRVWPAGGGGGPGPGRRGPPDEAPAEPGVVFPSPPPPPAAAAVAAAAAAAAV